MGYAKVNIRYIPVFADRDIVMRTLNISEVGGELQQLLKEENPVDEDIGILDAEGHLYGVIITKDAYDFFLAKTEEKENRVDIQTIRNFHESGESNR
jgi:PHD/YefM family antitoxin component YafN of YafNO toxin-antitoxin module